MVKERRTTFVDEAGWAAFSALKAGITGRKGEQAVATELKRLGFVALNDVILPCAEGVTQVDHIVRGRQAIIVIETKTYSGMITGRVADASWLQHFSEGSQQLFANPLRQNERHCRAVTAAISGTTAPIINLVVSAGTARFCEVSSTVVVPLDCLGDVLGAPTVAGDDGLLEEAWRQVCKAAAIGERRRDEHAEAMRALRETGPR